MQRERQTNLTMCQIRVRKNYDRFPEIEEKSL